MSTDFRPYRRHIRRLALDALAYVAAGAVWGVVAWLIADGWVG